MGNKTIALIAPALFFSTSVSAALVSTDLNSSGDGLITRDTSTNIEWLDLTESRNLSYDYVSSQFGVGGQFEGWRYATSSEVNTLFDSAGGTGPYDGYSTVNNGIGAPLLDMWGLLVPTHTWSEFIIGDVYGPGQHWYGQVWDNNSTQDFIYTMQGPVGDGVAHINKGSALVREYSVVPVPAAVWLFGTGLISIVGVARRKQSV